MRSVFTLTALLLSTTASFAQMNDDCRSNDRARIMSGCTIVLQNKVATNTDKSEAMWRRGEVFLDQNQMDAALLDLNKAVELNPKSADALAQLGRGVKLKGDNARALVHLSAALKIAPSFEYALRHRAETYANLARYAEGLADINQVIAINPTSIAGLGVRGRIHRLAGSLDLALADLNRALIMQPNYPYGYHQRGDAYMSKGDYAKALADYDRWLALQPTNTMAQSRRAAAFAQVLAAGGMPAAVPAQPVQQPAATPQQPRPTPVVQSSPVPPPAAAPVNQNVEQMLQQMRGARQSSNWQAVHTLATQVLNVQPNWAEAYLFRGIALVMNNKLVEADKDLSRAIEIDPTTAEALFFRGLVRIDLGRGLDGRGRGSATHEVGRRRCRQRDRQPDGAPAHVVDRRGGADPARDGPGCRRPDHDARPQRARPPVRPARRGRPRRQGDPVPRRRSAEDR